MTKTAAPAASKKDKSSKADHAKADQITADPEQARTPRRHRAQ